MPERERLVIRERSRVKKWESTPPDDPNGPDEVVETTRWFYWDSGEVIVDPAEIDRLERKVAVDGDQNR
jgi:hypothetical protein